MCRGSYSLENASIYLYAVYLQRHKNFRFSSDAFKMIYDLLGRKTLIFSFYFYTSWRKRFKCQSTLLFMVCIQVSMIYDTRKVVIGRLVSKVTMLQSGKSFY